MLEHLETDWGGSFKAELLRWLSISVALVVAAACIGTALLFLVELIPSSLIEANVRDAAAVLHGEGSYPRIFSGSRGTCLDNFTDGLMVNTAYVTSGNLVTDALLAPGVSVGDLDPMESLYEFLNAQDGATADATIVTYGRYWHGYLVFLRPLFVVASYPSIRSLNMALQIAAMLVLVGLLVRRRRVELAVGVGIMWVFLSPAALFTSMQYSTVFYPTVLSCIVLVVTCDRLGDLGRCVVFELTGIAVAYFDLLTYPLVSLGVPLVLYIALEYGRWGSLREAAARLLAPCASWALGYAGMWSAKWLIATAATDEDVIANALSQASFRLSTEGVSREPGVFAPIGVICACVKESCSAGFLALFALAAIAGCVLLVRRGTACLNVPAALSFAACALLPFVWYVTVINHSGVHVFFTYRELAISVFAAMSFLWVHVGESRHG